MPTETSPPADVRWPGSSPRPAASTTLLVVDDNPVDRRLAGGIAEQTLGWRVLYAENGMAALDLLAKEPADVVLTDLQMPEMDGLELVQEVRQNHALVPVVLMTAFGSEAIAMEALQKGAASYVPKACLETDLAEVLRLVLSVARGVRQRQKLLECITNMECSFRLPNERPMLSALVALLQETLVGIKLGDETARIRVGIALEEALVNAMYHGNLELSSSLRQDGSDLYERTAEERSQVAPYNERSIYVNVKLTPTEAHYVIRDEGPGFDPSTLPDPLDPANLEKPSGRGLLLMRTFMDFVEYNSTGNQVTMMKKKEVKRKGPS